MIMAVDEGQEQALVDYLQGQSVPAAVVGELTSEEDGYRLVESGEEREFQFDGRDPYWNAFFKAMEKGWK